MAKKGQAVQLQAEINNDEDWEKLLQKDGLIVVDVYSDWCGPCQGMAANLKKLKLEIGGDMLHLAMAKSDTVTALKRFKNKSEPTWMLISKGKMVNLMFGANAPKLTQMIIDELKMEQGILAGEQNREVVWEVTDLAPDEQVRYDVAENAARIAREKEEAKRTKEILERKTAECKNIITNLPGFGVILILPNGKNKYQEILTDLTNEAGLHITQTEKVNLTEEKLQEIMFFSHQDDTFNDDTIEDMLNDQSLMLLLKVHVTANIEDIDDVILTLVYGENKKAPGTSECVYELLFDSVEDESTGEVKQLAGIWVPPNSDVRSTALRMFFPKLTKQFEIPEPDPTPPYLAVIFDHKKIPEVVQIMNEFSGDIMHYGFFTDENPDKAELVAQSMRKLEQPENFHKRTFDERLVIQAARRSKCILALAQLGPIYMSPNAEEGKRECEIFFPEDYAEMLDEEDMNFETLSTLSMNLEKGVEEQTQEEVVSEDEKTEEEESVTEVIDEGEQGNMFDI